MHRACDDGQKTRMKVVQGYVTIAVRSILHDKTSVRGAQCKPTPHPVPWNSDLYSMGGMALGSGER